MSETSQTGWRVPRACEECRKRKIKCNSESPCKTCQLRNTPCIYRDYIRHRRKKHEYDSNPVQRSAPHPRQNSTAVPSVQRTSPDFPNSVSATHQASPSCSMQLYYGPTSHFSLMQHIYRDLVSHPTAQPEPPGGVVEASAGLDLFSFRRIFFGTPEAYEGNKSNPLGDVPIMFLPHDLAKMFLSRYLSSLYHLMPNRPKAYYEQCLDQLYNASPADNMDVLTQAMILLPMAIASLGTDHFAWGDILFERVKASMIPFDDVVNLQTVQISLLMISRPNSAFIHLGSSCRKALSAGLHKDVPHDIDQTAENVEERRVTFWSLYSIETWFCFHVGRPSSLSLKDAAIEYAQDPFIRLLARLCKCITRSADEIYGQRYESLLHMWKAASSITDELRSNEGHLKEALGFGLDAGIQPGSLGVRQTIFITLYYHTLSLTFRPFLIFRGHWEREQKMPLDKPTNRPKEAPSWLKEACKRATTAAQKTLHHLSEASRVNDLVRQLRYHGYFQGSSTFTLIYDFLHDPSVAPTHLPWVYSSLQTLSTMRAGDPVQSSISAIQTVLRKINPAYEWCPYPNTQAERTTPMHHGPALDNTRQSILGDPTLSQNVYLGARPDLPMSPWRLPQLEMPETGGSVGTGDELLDFTQADMGWDFDFSTMDLEAFFSVYQPNNAPMY